MKIIQKILRKLFSLIVNFLKWIIGKNSNTEIGFEINPKEYGLYALSSIAVEFNESIQSQSKTLGTNKKRALAMRSFFEMSERLDYRYSGLKHIESVMSRASCLQNVQVHRIQLEYVNRVESYFQHLYATISALAMLINTVADHELKQSLPISNMKKFLEHLGKFNELDVTDEVSLLEQARGFRAKFVDHIQQNKLCDWMTYGVPIEGSNERFSVVIYYIPKEDSISEQIIGNNPIDPYSDNFAFGIANDGYFVSPPYDKCHCALFNLARKVISYLEARAQP